MNKYQIGMAGELRICAELLKNGYESFVLHGNAPATDIVILGENRKYLRVEVKTSRNGRNFVTGYYPKYTDDARLSPDLWIFFLPAKDLSETGDRFFIASHEEVSRMQLIVNKGNKTLKGQGCDNIPLKELQNHGVENDWDLPRRIFKQLQESAAVV